MDGAGTKRRAFLLSALTDLDLKLRALGSQLIIRQGPAQAALGSLVDGLGEVAIFAHQDFSPFARQRDQIVSEMMNLNLFPGVVLQHPQTILKDDGDPYVVYTPYKHKWYTQPLPTPADCLPSPDALPPLPGGLESINLPPSEPLNGFPTSSEDALSQLMSFIADGIHHYNSLRNRLDLAGRTPAYGYHLDENRRPTLHVQVTAQLKNNPDFGALGKAIGDHIQSDSAYSVPYISGVSDATLENLKSFCASLATFGGAALFHMSGVTPEAAAYTPPVDILTITPSELEAAKASLNSAHPDEVDFFSLGCPHLTLGEIQTIAEALAGKQVTREFWITTSHPVKGMADRMGYTASIEAAGAKFATDTCCVVAPIKGRFHALATDSAKACYYATAKNGFKTRLLSLEQVVKFSLTLDNHL